MTPSLRLLAACALATAPMLALGQSRCCSRPACGRLALDVAAALRPDGQMRYALGAGANYASGTAATLASFNLGAESAVATTDSRWRFGGKALWARSVNETASAETTTLLVIAETQHRWSSSTWLR